MNAETHIADHKNHIIYDSTETCEENEYWLDDERTNLDRELPNDIIAIADLGLWDGHHKGYKILGRNLRNVLDFFGCDDISVSYDGTDIVSLAYHHDGTNSIRFRMLKEYMEHSEFEDKIFNETVTEEDIEEHTLPLGEYVEDIYGW